MIKPNSTYRDVKEPLSVHVVGHSHLLVIDACVSVCVCVCV